MYKDDILNLIEQSPLEIDTEIQMRGRPPTMANSEFLTNKEQGDWAERIVFKAINEYSKEYFAVEYGCSESIAAGDDGFADFYLQVFFDKAYIISFKDILTLVSNDNNDGNNFSIERDVKNQQKTTIKINIQIGKEVLGKIDMPEHKSAMKELDRGRLLFYVTFEGGKGYLDNELFIRDVINA